ncbi:phenylacetate--CoA ligase family protein [Fulvivirga lutea]|uniref:Phenylacetate--CoA ligase family protein n=1 Tax=Fulvivirga lutea TaxID=2810512 RepID=A0A974WFW1_9BACT|nr:phenylacetate--CoA ligase family protein [Fulvivirga lutea]QSE96803.1 phenylacetate--CoA ligase family protein [Fulvivirga lutea]
MGHLRRFLFQQAVFVEKLLNKEVKLAHDLLQKANSTIDKEGIQELQNEAFLKLIDFVYYNNNYYRSLFNEHGLLPESFQDIKDLSKIPLLTKDIIKSKRDQLLTPSIPDAECLTRTSGGTTGEPIYIDVNKQARINELYFYYRGLNWMGWKPGDTMVKFFGGSLSKNNYPTLKSRIKRWVSGEVFIPAFDLNSDTAPEILQLIKNQGPCFMQGYVSSIYTLALHAKQLNFKGLKIKGAFTTAEQLPQDQAELIREVFQCDVKGFYGCSEMNCLGFQKDMDGPYIIPDEILKINETTHPETGIEHSFLLTSLYNYRTPLINYLNGDNGSLGNSDPKYSTIDELYGRTGDLFVRRNGSYISSIVATQTMQITELTHKIKRYQLVQNDYDKVEFKYQLFDEAELGEDELQKILVMYKERLGDEFVITPLLTENFISSKNKKHRLMINLMSNK